MYRRESPPDLWSDLVSPMTLGLPALLLKGKAHVGNGQEFLQRLKLQLDQESDLAVGGVPAVKVFL